jgi:hypothetical protein
MKLLRRVRSVISGNCRDRIPGLSYTYFAIRFQNRKVPEFKLGRVNSELSCYVPDGVPWRQINYGQGEGLVEVDGREWSFYFGAEKGELCVYLESGGLLLSDAVQFVNAVANKISGGASYEVYLRAYVPAQWVSTPPKNR